MQQLKKTYGIYLILLILISTVSCKSIFRADSNSGIIDSSDYYILGFEPNEPYPIFENAQPTELTHNEIMEIESIIKWRIDKTIVEYRKESNNKYPVSDYQYNRQYVAAIDKNGEKLIWINFFCDDGDGFYNLRKELVNVADGGKCYFKIRVNLTKKEIISYGANGIA